MSRWPAVMLFLAVAVWSDLPAQVQDIPSTMRSL